MIRQLIKKEFKLQLSAIYFAIAVYLLSLVLTLLMTRSDMQLGSNNFTLGQFVNMFYAAFVIPCMTVVVPLFVGAATIAEERRLGMLEWQLSLPVAKIWQWLIKMACCVSIVLVASCIVRPVMDCLMISAANRPVEEMGIREPLPLLWSMSAATALLAMMCGAFASSYLSDPYKAFWGGIAVMVFLFFGGSLTGFAPSFSMVAGLVSSEIDGYAAIALLLVLIIMACNTYYHYRFERMRPARMILDMVGGALEIMLVLAAAAWFRWIFMG